MSTFFPASTPTHTFTLPFLPEECSFAVVTYKQQGRTVLAKEINTFYPSTMEGKCDIFVMFEQEESLLFRNNWDISVQINLITIDNKRRTSKPIAIEVGDQYERKVIGSA